MNTPSTAVSRCYPGRRVLELGLALAAVGMIAYALQIWMRRLTTPWYLPSLTTVGVVLGIIALWKRRTLWRILALAVLVLLAGAEWAFLLTARLPAYSGPVAVGRPFPPFATMRADGTPFTQRDLEGSQNQVLVFFRGRW